MQPKRTILAPVHANRGIEAAYRRKMSALVDEMRKSIEYWLAAAYRRAPPRMADLIAQDAAPSDEIRKRIRELRDQWIKRFEDAAPEIAGAWAKRIFGASDLALAGTLRDAGWTVKFRMTPIVRDAFAGTVNENVSLIKSIPQEYLQQVEGIVMRSYTAGRDLATMSKDLRALYPKATRRCALIARDQSNKANAVVNRARQLELGITEAIWMHSHAGKTPRPDHVAANGRKYNIAEGCLISGEYVQPGQEINCRCTSRPILPI